MFLIILAFLMKFADISKMQSKRCINNNNNTNNQNNNNNNTNTSIMSQKRWQLHNANNKTNSNSSSTSSGCDSSGSSSSKENNYQQQQPQQTQQQQQQQHHSLTPQQLQQLRHYQQLQQQQLQLLQQQLLQRKRLQQQLREQGVEIKRPPPTGSTATLTCNQQYLKQLRLQQQQQQQQHHLYNMRLPQHQQPAQHIDNFMFHNKNLNRNLNDILNNNNNNNNNLNPELQQLSNGGGRMIFKGQKSCRGMTEFSTNNDINNKTHLSSQPLQNSPRHHFTPYPTSNPSSSSTTNNTTHHLTSLTNNYPIHNTTNTQSSNAQFTKQQFTQTLKQQLINNNKNNQQTLPYNNSSANARTPSSNGSSVTHSPTHHHYRKPFNSPNNSPFAYCGGGGNQQQLQQQQQQHQQQQLLQQQRRNSGKLPFLTHTQYQQHLNDLLLQQQQLQQQQQQLLQSKDASDESELSEESLKQNVAIVLNNLDRYNNALRSIILNEQVNTNNSVFYDESDLNFLTGGNCGGGGNNNSVNLQHHHYQQQQQQHQLATMATAITPESDYNSNATTPGSRNSNMLPYESSGNMLPHNQQQPHQHLVGFSNTTTGGGGVNNGGGVLNNACGVGYMGNNLNCSLASSHDFTHDNSDYQWFLDYGYRDGCGGMQRSVLSSLSASYNGLGDLIYEDLAKNLDANLAEVDMESFRAEDIHSLLSQLPSYCKSLGGNRLQHSLMLQQHMLPSNNCQHQMAHNMSQTSTTSTNDLIDNSFCKSELLFSPVKESHISVDSLDMDAYPEDGDIILTCKANKDNYTIAFEGSVLYSDESFYEPNEIAMKNKQNFINLHSNLDDIVKRKSLEVSMSRSEQPQQCSLRNKLQKSHTTQLQRYPSGNNNNTPETITIIRPPIHLTTGCVRKCSSLPNLRDDTQEQLNSSQTQIHTQQQTPQRQQQQQHQQQLNVSTAITTSHIEHNLQQTKSRNLLPMCQIPISCNSTAASIEERLNVLSLQQQQQQQQQQCHTRQPKHRCCCGSGVSGGVGAIGSNLSNHSNVSMGSNNGSATIISHHSNKGHHITGSTSSGSSNPPAFNLVKLFIKQKSTNCSLEDQPSAHTCMDISSGCWPSSDANNSSSSSSLEQRLRKKSMNDSGKGSALSRHDEEADNTTSTFHMDASASTPKKQHQGRSSVFYEEDPSSSSTGSLTATNSPAHRRRSMPLRNPALNQLALQLNGNNNSSASLLSSDNTSEQLTQVQLSGGQESSSSSAKAAERNKQRRSRDASRPISNASSSEMITRSMQTSCGSLSTRSSLSDRFRFVPPSFLEKLNNLGEENQAPIYVIYPNYALPDLGFVKTSATPDVIFSPFNYKMNMGGNTSTASSCASIKKRFSLMTGSDEDEILKTMDYKHVVDWQSLATLLPGDYRRRLKHIPEVNGILSHLERELAQKPLFCLTPPVRRNRTHICDCNQYFQRGEQQTEAAGGSSSSGSSHQPSSGYRGSSTLLTDSEFENANNNAHGGGDNLKQMYVYQYEQQRMDSGVEMSPKVQSTPIPMPRGILRKSSSAVRSKRNSMIEQDAKLTKLEKRRSLQEAPYNYHIGSAEELAEVFEEEISGAEIYATPQPRTERLSRKDLDARARAENFLSSLPRNELKYYAEIASILESSEQQVQYDAAALKKEVSRALSQQKKVSFNDKEEADSTQNNLVHLPTETRQRFTTPPNSPNISMATNATATTATNNATLRQPATAAGFAAPPVATRRCSKRDELEKQKLESNRFKRLQIQWELMSKDSSMLKELALEEQTKSGGSTPTSAVAAANAAAAAAAQKSRIPRPVSYPAGKRTDNCKIPRTTTMTETPHKINNIANNTKIPKPPCAISPQLARITNQADPSKATRSPSRIQPPKRYSMTAAAAVTPSPITTPTSSAGTTTTRARTPNSRVAVTAPNTPKKRVQSPRTIPRVR
ncbi:homeobox protein 5 isoform X2 [Calliphora vicina]|uniref:homeobox protein 5 isoform X2 n=1 Tax=Calliphora vicina TaxID=7373 RepID=UPI00325AAB5D